MMGVYHMQNTLDSFDKHSMHLIHTLIKKKYHRRTYWIKRVRRFSLHKCIESKEWHSVVDYRFVKVILK